MLIQNVLINLKSYLNKEMNLPMEPYALGETLSFNLSIAGGASATLGFKRIYQNLFFYLLFFLIKFTLVKYSIQ